ncbi:MAG: hypothetical protein KDC98_19225, partial [Planctomycetes bacterium]|nr:hypothetical protein [Planctomycetota bacterium]
TRWTYWWEFNKNSYLLRPRGDGGGPQTGSDDFFLGSTRRQQISQDSLEPTEKEAIETILPALKKAIDSTDNRDMATACMIAMAKVGRDHPDFALIDVFADRLPRGDQEVRETAALAIGIAAIDGTRELELLLSLAEDGVAGREASRGSKVTPRTRAFAAYGLGLMANRSQQLATKLRVTKALTQLIDGDDCERNLLVAAIHGLSLVRLDSDRPGERALSTTALDCLERCYLSRRGPGDQLMQAHCPTAIARLIDRDDDRAQRYRELFAATLGGKERPARSSRDLPRSCALALGRLVRPVAEDRPYCEILLDAYRGNRDQQTRYFAIIALGLIGGADNREALLREFGRASKTQEKPWCALALGLLEHGNRTGSAAATQQPDRLIGETLLDALETSKNPDLTGALAVALGLCQFIDATPTMRQLLRQSISKAELAGYLCIGLALMRDRHSTDALRDVLQLSLRRDDLMRQAAIGLGHLGDREAALALHAMLADDDPNLARLAAIANGLGYVGDRRSIEPLLTVLFDTEMTKLCRAFAAAALGGVADKERAPWNSKISEGINYRAAVETLIDNSTGILDIL